MGPVTVVLVVVVVMATSSSGRSFGECEFPDRDCGWNWSDGWNLLSAQNLTVSSLGTTAPAADAQNNVKGLFLYWSAREDDKSDYKLEIESPIFEAHTLPTCALQMSLHMYQMDPARFQVVIKAPNSTWESTRFSGTSAHTWETQIEPIGLLSKPFKIILEIINESPVYPSHVAVDDIQITRCYEKRKITTDCRGRQFQCYDLICIEGSGVCDITPQCTSGEDEEQDCDKLPESAYCTFENGMCGWISNDTETGKWILRRGEEGTKARTGPTVDHTYRNETGRFLMAKFPHGRTFGNQATFTSPWFAPPPYYHRNVHSAYFNSCQVRFHFHKFGSNMGELRMYTLELDQPGKPRLTDLWRSYGNKGDVWWNAVVSLPNMTNIYQIQFVATRGVGQSDISIDDLTLSPECFGLGVPENESIVPATEYDAASDRSVAVIQIEQCENRWRCIRNCFYRHRRSLPPSGFAATSRKKRHYLQPKKQSSNLEYLSPTEGTPKRVNITSEDPHIFSENLPPEELSEEPIESDPDESFAEDNFLGENSFNDEADKRKLVITKGNKKERTEESNSFAEVDSNYFSGKQNAREDQDDGFVLFFKSLLPEIRKFSDRKKRSCKSKILEVVNILAEEDD